MLYLPWEYLWMNLPTFGCRRQKFFELFFDPFSHHVACQSQWACIPKHMIHESHCHLNRVYPSTSLTHALSLIPTLCLLHDGLNITSPPNKTRPGLLFFLVELKAAATINVNKPRTPKTSKAQSCSVDQIIGLVSPLIPGPPSLVQKEHSYRTRCSAQFKALFDL